MRQRGMALVAVLWIVAALSIVVASLTYAVRTEIRALSGAQDALEGEAVGQAAIQLVLQEIDANPLRSQKRETVNAVYRDIRVSVQVQPLTGLVDVNNASEPLLAALFRYAGGVSGDRALALAASAVAFRGQKDGRDRPVSFEAPEDLLQVPGVDYDLYAKLAALITTDIQGGGRVSPTAASPEVLMVLAAGNVARASSIAAARDSGQVGIDTTALNGEFTDINANTQLFLLQSRVPMTSGKVLWVSRVVNFSSGVNGLHWRTLRTGVRFESLASERE